MPFKKKYFGGSIKNNTINGTKTHSQQNTPRRNASRRPYTSSRTTKPYTVKKTIKPYISKRSAKKTAKPNTSKKRKTGKTVSLKFNKCMHWFRINNFEKVDCLLQDNPESDSRLKILIGSAQNGYNGNYRKIVEDFLNDNYAFNYFMTKSNKEKGSLLGFFMVLQGGEYGPSYGMPSQKWLNECVNAKKKNN